MLFSYNCSSENFLPKQSNNLQSVMFAQPPQPLSFKPKLMSPSPFLTPFPRGPRPINPQEGPHSVNNEGTSIWPPCINHRRRRTTHLVTLEEGEIVHFCRRCMQQAQLQGFKGSKVEEFHGSLPCKTFKKHCQEKTKMENINMLNQYLEDLKKCYEKAGQLLQSFGHHNRQVIDSNYICHLFQRFEIELHRLKQQVFEKMTIQQTRARKEWLEIRSAAEWLNQDLEHMISRVCRNHQQITEESQITFNSTLAEMRKDLKQKQQNYLKLGKKYKEWKDLTLQKTKDLRQQAYKGLQSLWESLWLGDISKISFQDLLEPDISANVCQIVQELSTNHTLY